MDIVLNQNVTTNMKNADLKKVTTAIQKASANVIGNTFKIASLIARVESEELYVEDGYDDVFDYAKKCFGLEKTSVYNLVRVGNDFITAVEHGKITSFETLLTHGDHDYSISQVFKMLPLGIEKAKELTADGVINESMSCRAIEKIVKDNTEGRVTRGKSKTEKATPEPATENENEDEDDNGDVCLMIVWDDLPDEVKLYFMDRCNETDGDGDNITSIQISDVVL